MLKHFICGLACAASMLWSMLAQVQNFPIKPITLVSPFPAGTVTDSVTRIVAKALSESIGQAVIVDIGRGMAQVNGQKARRQPTLDPTYGPSSYRTSVIEANF